MQRPQPKFFESSQQLQVGSVLFDLDISESMRTKESRGNTFLLAKTPEMISNLLRRTENQKVGRIFDLGIFKGGSVAMYNELFTPEKLVAIEYQSEPVAALTDYIKNRDLESVVRPYYSTDQSDARRLDQICATEFKDEPIDLVIDDASHFYEQTKSSFNTLFPKLRPEGLYVIEDWGWSHWPGDHWQKPTGALFGKTPLSVLVFEIIMSCASTLESAIKNVTVTGSVAYIERGYAQLPTNWDISGAYLTRNEPWWPVK
jgi:predicted O-methyltransferase YrrM